MSLAIAKKPSPVHHNKKKHAAAYEALKSPQVYPNPQTPIFQRKTISPCDGGCPRCAGVIQPKLTIGHPNDIYEQEADRIAEQVMRMPETEVNLKSS